MNRCSRIPLSEVSSDDRLPNGFSSGPVSPTPAFRRAASSIALNLAEGSGRFGKKDQKRFFQIALASLRECQAVLDIEDVSDPNLRELVDCLGAHIFKLLQS